MIIVWIVNISCAGDRGILDNNSENVWVASTQEWLKASQIHLDGFLAFSEQTSWFLDDRPDLYVTAWFAIIGRELGERVSSYQRQSISNWLDTLRTKDGHYRDPSNNLDPFYSTQLAVQAYEGLMEVPKATGVLVAYLSGILKSIEGLCNIGELKEVEKPLLETLEKTRTILRIFCSFTVSPKNAEKTRRCLKELARRVGFLNHDSLISFRQGALIIDCLRLLDFNPADLPEYEAWQRWTTKWAAQLITDNIIVDGPTLGTIEELLTMASYLKIQLPENNVLIREKLKTAQLEDGGFALFPGMTTLEPQTTYAAIRIFSYLDAPYPKKAKLVSTMTRYEVKNGWKQIVGVSPDLRATLHGVGISKAVALPLPRSSIIAYLDYVYDKVLDETETDRLIRLLYYMNRVYHLLDSPPPERDSLARLSEGAISAILASQNTGDLEVLALGMETLEIIGLHSKAPLYESVCEFVSSLQNEDGGFTESEAYSDVMATYYALIVSRVANCEDVNVRAAVTWIKSLQTQGGGFRRSKVVPFADLDSTFHAYMALVIGQATPLQSERLLSYVDRCKFRPFGFSFIPVNSPWMSHFSGIPTNLKLTYEGLALLGDLNSQPYWTMAELPP
jgi:hypothetical protein